MMLLHIVFTLSAWWPLRLLLLLRPFFLLVFFFLLSALLVVIIVISLPTPYVISTRRFNLPEINS